jgi:tol-pal system beta propeller repeat protein TolB
MSDVSCGGFCSSSLLGRRERGKGEMINRAIVPLAALAVALVLACTAVALLVAAQEPAEAAFPGHNGRIAFDSVRPGDSDLEIYTIRPDGTGLRQVTFNAKSDYSPAWSPDGLQIAFVRSEPFADGEIWVKDSRKDTRIARLTQLTNNTVYDDGPAWSPDGSKIVFASFRDGNWDIYVMNADGSGQKRLTTDPEPDRDPVWSPDGSKIAFWSSRDGNLDIWAMDADGSNQTNLTQIDASQSQGAIWPNWSPDGSKIVFERDSDIWVVDADGSNQTNVSDTPESDESNPAWSPNGKKIVFENYVPDVALDIWKMNADGTNRRNLTNTPGGQSEFRPDWQPRPVAAG